jgi:hypothetical protein
MGVPTSEVGYTSATAGRGDHEVHTGHLVALEKKTPTRVSKPVVTVQPAFRAECAKDPAYR